MTDVLQMPTIDLNELGPSTTFKSFWDSGTFLRVMRGEEPVGRFVPIAYWNGIPKGTLTRCSMDPRSMDEVRLEDRPDYIRDQLGRTRHWLAVYSHYGNQSKIYGVFVTEARWAEVEALLEHLGLVY